MVTAVQRVTPWSKNDMSEEKKSFHKNKWGNIFGHDMQTPLGRLIYPHLRQRSQLNKKFQICLLFDKKNKDVIAGLKLMKAAGMELIKEAGKAGKTYQNAPVRNGDDKDKEEFHGKYFIQATNPDLPLLVDVDNNPISAEDFQSGMICRAVVSPRFYPANGAGISWQFTALRKVKDDGIRFYNGPDPKLLFSDDSDAADEAPEEEEESDELDAAPAPKAAKKKAKKPEPVEEEEEEEEETEESDELDDDSADADEDSDELDEDDAPPIKKKAAAAKSSTKTNGAAEPAKRGRPKKSAADQIMDVL